MKTVTLNNIEYEVIEDEFNKIIKEELEEKITDYFNTYDYIFGDYAYDKLRLKGFYESSNKKVNKINDIKILDKYKKDYCSYGAKTFLLKKVIKAKK